MGDAALPTRQSGPTRREGVRDNCFAVARRGCGAREYGCACASRGVVLRADSGADVIRVQDSRTAGQQSAAVAGQVLVLGQGFDDACDGSPCWGTGGSGEAILVVVALGMVLLNEMCPAVGLRTLVPLLLLSTTQGRRRSLPFWGIAMPRSCSDGLLLRDACVPPCWSAVPLGPIKSSHLGRRSSHTRV